MQGRERGQWASRFGFLMAAAGSAIGLGNIWRFPYLAGENGGSAFILIYIFFVIILGISLMLTEFTIGRRAKSSAVGAYKSVNKSWTFAGFLGVLTAFLIMGYYPVVGGWSLAYIFKSVSGLLSAPDSIGGAFESFAYGTWEPLLFVLLFMAANIVVVVKGVVGGIEKAAKILMPLLFGLLFVLIIKGLTLEGAQAGLDFLFKPNFVDALNGKVVLTAMGQAFLSLSLGMGAMITYGSYLDKDADMPSNAAMVSALDTMVALMAGLAIFPALFAFGFEPKAGPGLVFIVVPTIFANMGVIGPVLSVLFFTALFVAALTSTVSLLEVVSAYLIDEHGVSRQTAVVSLSVVMTIFCAISSLSLGGTVPALPLFNVPMFDFLDLLTDKVFLASGGVLVSVFAGWFIKREDLERELSNDGRKPFALFNVWYFLVKYLIPVFVTVVAISGMMAIKEKSVLIAGIVIILGLGVFSKKL